MMAKIKETMTVSLEEFGKKAGEYALDEFEYKGLTIRQWADKITGGEYQPVEQDTELSIILQDYGIKDTDTLRYILDQYQKIIVDITSGQMSYLTYPAEAVIACADDNYRKCYEESMKHGEWIFHGRRDENGRNIYRCSECNFEVEVFPYNLISWRTHEKYCPGCGARMDGDSDDQT